jgi:lipoprotein-anchoring transpeptidase ErfK/SrfK
MHLPVLIGTLLILLFSTLEASNTSQKKGAKGVKKSQQQTYCSTTLMNQKRVATKKRTYRKKPNNKPKKMPVYEGKVEVVIDVSKQRMKVYHNKRLMHTCKVSTGKKGFATPRGNFKPLFLERMHYSKKYDNTLMPYSIFFKGGYAIHGTKAIRRLGKKASHGCVRLKTSNAKWLYRLVEYNRRWNTQIKIIN